MFRFAPLSSRENPPTRTSVAPVPHPACLTLPLKPSPFVTVDPTLPSDPRLHSFIFVILPFSFIHPTAPFYFNHPPRLPPSLSVPLTTQHSLPPLLCSCSHPLHCFILLLLLLLLLLLILLPLPLLPLPLPLLLPPSQERPSAFAPPPELSAPSLTPLGRPRPPPHPWSTSPAKR